MITDKNIGLKATIQVMITITFDTMTYTIIYVYIIALVCRNFMLALADSSVHNTRVHQIYLE